MSGGRRYSGKYAVFVMAAIVAALFAGGLVLAYRLTPIAERWREGDPIPDTRR